MFNKLCTKNYTNYCTIKVHLDPLNVQDVALSIIMMVNFVQNVEELQILRLL